MAVASRARSLDHEEPLLRTDLTLPAARTAAFGPALAARAVAAAWLAPLQRLDFDRRLLAGERFLEAQLEIIPQVRAARGALPAAPALVHEFAEDRREDVREAVEPGTAAKRIAAHPALLEGGMAEAVIGRALL